LRDLQDPLGYNLFLSSLRGEIAGHHVAAEEPGGRESR
jgi:hypothetical protein